MNRRIMRRFFCLIWVALAVGSAASDRAIDSAEAFSPDGKYSVRLERTALSGADPVKDSTLVIVHNGRAVSRFPTLGSLSEVFWSPAGYAAVNNRRANNGDYLWVFRLQNGKALKVADDNNVFLTIAQRVSTKFPNLSPGSVLRGYMTTLGWKNANELRVQTGLIYQNMADATIEVVELYRVEGDSLNRVHQDIHKVPLPARQ